MKVVLLENLVLKLMVAFRQELECGFQGRTNKLVDGCYSFWQGGSLFLIQRLFSIAKNQIKSLLISTEQPSIERNVNSTSFIGHKSDGSPSQTHYFDSKNAGQGSATRFLLHRLNQAFAEMPIFVLVDWNPASLAILSTYKYGSITTGLESYKYTCNVGDDGGFAPNISSISEEFCIEKIYDLDFKIPNKSEQNFKTEKDMIEIIPAFIEVKKDRSGNDIDPRNVKTIQKRSSRRLDYRRRSTSFSTGLRFLKAKPPHGRKPPDISSGEV